MARAIHKLSVKGVEAKRKPGYFADGGGLYLQVSPVGSKSWIFRFTLKGKSREMGLGPLTILTLEKAREQAAAQRTLLHAGVDPIEARNAAKARVALDGAKAITFSECAAAYIKAHRAGWKNAKHAGQWENTIDTYATPVLGNLPVQGVDTGLIYRVLEPIWTVKPETATRLRARIERVLDWATVRGFRTGENPARLKGHLDKLLPQLKKKRQRVRHHPALPFEEIGAFVRDLRAEEGVAPRALELLILTAGRTTEIIGALPDEFDLGKATWKLDAKRMKAFQEHRVPLPRRALEIVKEQLKQHPTGYVFPGQKEGKPLSNMALLEVLQKRMGRQDLTVHGFRSTFRDWASERTSFPREVCEMALAHTIGDDTEAAYRRGDLFEKRRKLMALWAEHCDTPVRKSGKVASIRQEAA